MSHNLWRWFRISGTPRYHLETSPDLSRGWCLQIASLHPRSKINHTRQAHSGQFPRPFSAVARMMSDNESATSDAANSLSPPPALTLTETEATLRRLLMDVARYINPKKPSELRFTGGWVRDKLLGEDSHDIDVAINDMTGFQYGLRLKEYLERPGNAEKYGINDQNGRDMASNGGESIVKALHKIEANPEKSKHLETVTTKILGLDIDLVNLRKEAYSEDSRNPQMDFGTPEEDALRRDATINALFYNLQSGLVEDFTKRGLADKREKLIRTPMEPYQTFKDDPLRVLRLIRFAARLGWTIDPAAEAAMNDESIRTALKAKISRERVGVEIEKMLRGPRPLMAVELINRLGLFSTVFVDPSAASTYSPDVSTWSVAYSCAARLVSGEPAPLAKILLPNKDHEYIMWVMSTMVPWFDAPVPTPSKSGKKPPEPMAVAVLREGIKATSKICSIATAAILNAGSIREVKDAFVRAQRNTAADQTARKREVLGMALRRWGSSWKSQMALAIMLESKEAMDSGRDVIGGYETFVKALDDMSLLDVCDEKPLIDGNVLAKVFSTKPGPWMKDALDVVMEYQLANPKSASKDEATELLRSKKGELTQRLIGHFLQLTVRPMFEKTRSSEITSQGHKSLNNTEQRRRGQVDYNDAIRPWKATKNEHVLKFLEWIVASLDSSTTEKFWPLLVPPILTLVDDLEVQYKVLGCRLLHGLLCATSPSLLKRTGLGPVFKQSIGPGLSYLPTLTPEHDSITMLSAAYPALLELGELQCEALKPPPDSENDMTKRATYNHERRRFLSGVLYDHILPSCNHVGEAHPAVMVVLLAQLEAVVKRMRVSSVTVLKYTIPLVNDILTNPFAVASYPLLLQAVATLKQIVINGWPRIWRWKHEIMFGLCSCWLTLAEEEPRPDDEETKEKLRNAIAQATDLVVEATEAVHSDDRDVINGQNADTESANFRQDLCELLATDADLHGLLGKYREGPETT